ncbi:MAG: SDR family oxidoreductase [Burkholderiales bacterium]
MNSPVASPPALPAGMQLQGRRVLVTGAASGIGQATARVFAQLGADLVLTDRASLAETLAQVTELGAKPRCIEGDLTDDAFVDSLVAQGPYYSLAHVAAVFWPPKDVPEKQGFDFIMDVNIRVPMRLAHACIEQMAANGGGRVVLVGSAAGRHGGISLNGGLEYATYAASKGGLHTLVRWLSRRAVQKNVMVNAVAPGMVLTPMFATVTLKPDGLPIGRFAQPEELGWPIAFLCSPAASYVSGVVLDVNGGAFVSA